MSKRRRADAGDACDAVLAELRRVLPPLCAGGRAPPGLVVGLTAVTRALQLHDLRCVLMCHDAHPKALVKHIPTLAARRGVPLLRVSAKDGTGSLALGDAVGVSRTVVALAFRSVPAHAPPAKGPALAVAQLGGWIAARCGATPAAVDDAPSAPAAAAGGCASCMGGGMPPAPEFMS